MYDKTAAVTLSKTMKMNFCLVAAWMVVILMRCRFTSGDRYRIDIDPDEDDVLVLISAVVIDMASNDDDYRRDQSHMGFPPWDN